METDGSLPHSTVLTTCPYPELLYEWLVPWHIFSEELLEPHPTLKLEDHRLSAIRECLFNIFAATLRIGVCSFIWNFRRCHTMLTGTILSRSSQHCCFYQKLQLKEGLRVAVMWHKMWKTAAKVTTATSKYSLYTITHIQSYMCCVIGANIMKHFPYRLISVYLQHSTLLSL
jgi:hypothetical protein